LVWKNGDAHQRIQFAVTTSRSAAVPASWKVYRAHLLTRMSGLSCGRSVGGLQEHSRRNLLYVSEQRRLQRATATTMKSWLSACFTTISRVDRKVPPEMTREIAVCHG
jgi:hypothetical protein